MTVIDIAAARDRRAAAKRHAHQLGQVIADRLVSQAISQAERAFRVADPILASDPEMARDIYRGAHRRLRLGLRRFLGVEASADLTRRVLKQAETVYRGEVWPLIDERDALRHA